MTSETAGVLMNLMIFAPIVGIPFLLFSKSDSAKWWALVGSLIPLVLSIVLYAFYLNHSTLGAVEGETMNNAHNGMVISYTGNWWFAEGGKLDIKFMTGMDGISVYLVLLTTVLFPLTIWFSFGSVHEHEKAYYALLLILEVGVIGFFLALDMAMFYVFFEMVLIPMYFLIGIWGGKERIYASLKFFLYTLVGSLLMLVAIIYCGFLAGDGAFTTDYFKLVNAGIAPEIQGWLFLAFAASFAIKVPLFPLHTWLPDAHTQTPTAGSVILAGVLLKMGTYGLVRFCLPIFPDASIDYAPMMSALAVVGIIYGGMAAMVQDDVKKLVAYSSVSHLGFIVLGIFAFTPTALDGAVIQMVSHGITTGALFLLVGMIYDRRHTRLIADFQGLARVTPVFTLMFVITMLASVGLPGLNGFVGEFMILIGSYQSSILSGAFAIVATTGVIIAAVYLLWMFRRVMFGELDKEENRKLLDLNRREVGVMLPLVILMFVFGFSSKPFLKEIDHSAKPIVERVLNKGVAPAPAQPVAIPVANVENGH